MGGRAILLTLGLAALAGCGKDGPKMYPAKGSVLVNSRPAERVTVSFHHTDPSVKGNAAHPCAVTDAGGNFTMATNTDGDGAVGGEYLVTFTWQSDPDRAKDLFGGAYAEQKKSTFRVKVPADAATQLPPFDLTAPEKDAKRFVK